MEKQLAEVDLKLSKIDIQKKKFLEEIMLKIIFNKSEQLFKKWK